MSDLQGCCTRVVRRSQSMCKLMLSRTQESCVVRETLCVSLRLDLRSCGQTADAAVHQSARHLEGCAGFTLARLCYTPNSSELSLWLLPLLIGVQPLGSTTEKEVLRHLSEPPRKRMVSYIIRTLVLGTDGLLEAVLANTGCWWPAINIMEHPTSHWRTRGVSPNGCGRPTTW